MKEKLSNLLISNYYMPHGHCYLWQTPLVWFHVVGDGLIALAYFSISIALIYFIRNREDIPFKNVFILFSAFILSCGTTHMMEIVTLWYPLYWLSGTIKSVTAVISVITAIELFPLIPKALALPSPTHLKRLNQEIRQLNLELEQRVKDRTSALEEINKELLQRNHEMSKLKEMSEFLQVCNVFAEAKSTIGDLIKLLFPKMSGAVYIIDERECLLEKVSSWGNSQTKDSFYRNECWALRKGSYYITNIDSPNLYCEHYHQDLTPRATLCVPITVQGKIFGLLHLNQMDLKQISQSTLALAQAVAQQLSLSFANLKLKETLQEHSLRDPLTRLFNRRYLEEFTTKEIHRATRNGIPMGIIMIDVDYFKNFNDNYGHEAGDFVLKELSKYLEKKTRKSDVVCRYGGEEFILILPDTSLKNTLLHGEKIKEEVKYLNLEYHQKSLQITISLGVACFPKHGLQLEDLLNAADRALYLAKKQGRDRIVSL